MIQLDMVGQGKGYYLIASGRDDQDASVLAALENAAQQVQGRLSVERVETASDHLAFHVRGIPSVLLSWEQPQYVNQPADTPETIDVLKLQAVTRITALTLMALADE
jgi:Zn-dependent M28 family amino/carboxypeptidase